MTPDFAQRRRVAIAVAVTAVAVPAAVLFDRGTAEPDAPVTTTVGSVVAADQALNPPVQQATQGTDPMGTTISAFLQQSGTVPPDEPATIAIPRLPEAVEGRATFSRRIPRATSCQVDARLNAPVGIPVTVTNLDNSRSVRCINDTGVFDPDHEIVLHPDALAQIGDLTDAPLPVQISW